MASPSNTIQYNSFPFFHSQKFQDTLKKTFCRKMKFLFVCLISIVPFTSLTPVFGVQLNWLGHWKGEDKREILVHEVKKNYEFLHPGTSINLKFNVDLEGEGDYYKMKVAHKIVEMIKTGKIEWDLVFCDISVYRHVSDLLGDPQWGKKHLVDFTEIPGFLQSQKNFIVNTTFYKDKMGGIFPGPYIEGIIFCLWYTRQAAEKTGIIVKEKGMTVKEFLGYAEQHANYNRTHGTHIPFLYINSLNRIEALFEYIFKSHFSDPQTVIEEKYSVEKAEAFLATLEIFEKLSQYQPVVNEGWRTLNWVDCEKDFLSGNGLFLPGGTYMYSHFRGNSPENYSKGIPIEQPYAKQPNGLVGIFLNTFAVMKDSPNKQAAIELSMMWAEPIIAEKWVDYTKNPTGVRGNLNQPVLASEKVDVYGQFLQEMEQQYKSLPMRNYRTPTYAFGKEIAMTDEEFRNNLVLILEGKLKAKDYYQTILSRIERP